MEVITDNFNNITINEMYTKLSPKFDRLSEEKSIENIDTLSSKNFLENYLINSNSNDNSLDILEASKNKKVITNDSIDINILNTNQAYLNKMLLQASKEWN